MPPVVTINPANPSLSSTSAPATASAPLVTSIADVAGVLIYFGLAAALLPLLDASVLLGG